MRDLRIPADAGDLGRLLLRGIGADPRDLGIGRVGQVGDEDLPIASAGGQFQRVVRAEGHGRHGPTPVLRNGGEEGRRFAGSSGNEGRGIKDADGAIGHATGDETFATSTDGPIDRREAAGRLDLAQYLGLRLILWIGNVEAVQLQLTAIIVKAKPTRFLRAVICCDLFVVPMRWLQSKDTEGIYVRRNVPEIATVTYTAKFDHVLIILINKCTGSPGSRGSWMRRDCADG